ncbi:uncharacterized protein LOC131336257 [Rhododendron vialii]|uniref:uncharacterized protein LOC131336257 n=1 Tax=Rhododendron vialii TaxID=182163 RepID=UPI00265F518E|nr:uncharacterized protein LOC131336257 [Rhododendron vialii]
MDDRTPSAPPSSRRRYRRLFAADDKDPRIWFLTMITTRINGVHFQKADLSWQLTLQMYGRTSLALKKEGTPKMGTWSTKKMTIAGRVELGAVRTWFSPHFPLLSNGCGTVSEPAYSQGDHTEMRNGKQERPGGDN